MDRLFQVGADDLEFARRHIERFYSSDFFPDVAEFEAIWAHWDQVSTYLTGLNVYEMGQPPLCLAAPKSHRGYRLVHQLHPYDSLIYTSLAHHIAEAIESRRVPRDRGVVCSYRIELNRQSGGFFDGEHDGYKVFHDRTAELAYEYGHVLTLDIANFYNHVYIHRLQNSLEGCGSQFVNFSHAVEEFLLNLNQRESIGIPVGPAASIIFSEALLVDVDDFLVREFPKLEYVRYVDDFRFFSNSRLELEEVHHSLASYLYRAHRLTLASGKCSLLENLQYFDTILSPPEDAEAEALRREVTDTLDLSLYLAEGELTDDSPSWEDATVSERSEALKQLFARVVAEDRLDLGLARHLLRRARRARFRVILPTVLASADKLLPAFRDVGLYLQAVLTPSAISRHMTGLEGLVENDALSIPYARHWLGWLFATRPEFSASPKLEAFMTDANSDDRASALFSRTNARVSWIKNRKDTWNELGGWNRRGLLLAGEVLAKKERNAWMSSVIRSPSEPLDAIIAQFVNSR